MEYRVLRLALVRPTALSVFSLTFVFLFTFFNLNQIVLFIETVDIFYLLETSTYTVIVSRH